jgi:signal transduction histidine kinase
MLDQDNAKQSEEAGAVGLASDRLRWLEQDRQWIAAELHDGLVQDVTGARMQLESLVLTGKIPAGAAWESVLKVVELLRHAVEEARRFILGLSPPMLEEKGVVGAIECLLAEWAEPGPKIHFSAEVAFGRLEVPLETAIYRIVQEGVANVRRHSKSERAEVRIAQVADRLEISVQDWGVGFDPAQVEGKCFGLKGIRERARLLGGSARVDSQPGEGTRITVSLPLAGPLGKPFTTIDRSIL